MKSRLWGIIGTCFFALVTTISSASAVQPLEGRLPEVPGVGDHGSVPVAVWVVVIALIGLVEIARRNSAGR
jgi:hypothetical protein